MVMDYLQGIGCTDVMTFSEHRISFKSAR